MSAALPLPARPVVRAAGEPDPAPGRSRLRRSWARARDAAHIVSFNAQGQALLPVADREGTGSDLGPRFAPATAERGCPC